MCVIYVFQEHFSDDMWENEKIFGIKQKLKPNAVPIKEPHMKMLNNGEINIYNMIY